MAWRNTRQKYFTRYILFDKMQEIIRRINFTNLEILEYPRGNHGNESEVCKYVVHEIHVFHIPCNRHNNTRVKPLLHILRTRHAFVKRGCPQWQQSRNIAKSRKSHIDPTPSPGAGDVSEVWATLRWTCSPSLDTVSPLNIALCL